LTAESPPARSSRSVVRSVARTVLWPLRRFFDPRFVAIHDAVQDVRRMVIADLDARNEAAVLTGRTLDSIQEQIAGLRRLVAFDPDAELSLAELDEKLARILNYAAGHKGFAAQANLWFNPPILVGYDRGDVGVRWINERIVEVPYLFRALSRVPLGARVLDVGATESTVCLSLATLGYSVTAVDPRPNPLSHERLETVVANIEEWHPDDADFDAVLCLSTIEHIGTSAYEQESAAQRLDLSAMERMRELAKSGALLVLTTAVGQASVTDFGRVYDREGLDELLRGWDVDDLTLVQRRDETTWVTIDGPITDLPRDAETVAMVTATKSSS
jgi:SAM-dependent methyltransferase